MALRCGLFDSTEVVEEVGGFAVGNKAQSADFFARYFASFVGSGVLGGENGFAVSPDVGLRVRLSPGSAFLKGYFCFDDEEWVSEFSYSGSDRNLFLILRLDEAAGVIERKWIPIEQGPIPKREGGIFDLVLAQLYLPGGSEAVSEDMLLDLRGEGSQCGEVRTLCHGGAERLAEPFTIRLGGGCEGFIRTDGGQDGILEVEKLHLSHATGVLPIACGGTGGVSAQAARANLDAAAAEHTHTPDELQNGSLGRGVLAENGVDADARLRNISFAQTLPASAPEGTLCVVWGETGRGLYLYLSGTAVRIA